jgi:hypothetical protein
VPVQLRHLPVAKSRKLSFAGDNPLFKLAFGTAAEGFVGVLALNNFDGLITDLQPCKLLAPDLTFT